MIRDNAGADSSVFHVADHDVTQYSDLRVDFSFYARGLKDDEDFFLEYSSDGGEKWVVVKHYVVDQDFTSDQFTQSQVVFSQQGTFPFTAKGKIRFRCDANDNEDRVYIDEVRFEGLLSIVEPTVDTNCLGSSLNKGDTISVGESICTKVDGEAVYFGIWEHPKPNDPGYILYQVEIRSELGTYNRKFSGLGTDGLAPALKLQGDGHLVFGSQAFSSCVAKPVTQGREKRLIFKEEDGKPILKIFDDTEGGDLVWKLDGSSCYPDTPDSCVTALKKDHRLSWQDYVCQYDSEGKVSFQFGLSEDGLLGLWRYSQLIWRPSGGNLRGDYLHFQDDGHLTLYRDTTPKTHKWTSDNCIDYTASKLTLTGDGDVMETNEYGAIVWILRGSQLEEGVPAPPSDPRDSVEEVCMPGCDSCVPPNVPLFTIDEDVDIGDTLIRPGPAFAKRCGARCYDVKDNGDDPPLDPKLGDTLRFAYKTVSSYSFVFRSLVCGTVCDGHQDPEKMIKFGSTGLMVRKSLDPLAVHVFASHQRDAQANWSYRTVYDELPTFGFDGSPDVECLWITLERDQNEFTFSYAYPSEQQDDQCAIDVNSLDDLTTTVTIDMPEQVLVGLGVSTGIAPPFCSFTQARFTNIELLQA
jgi:hypothetical protein